MWELYQYESCTIKKYEYRIDTFARLIDTGAREDSWESLGQQGDQTSQP